MAAASKSGTQGPKQHTLHLKANRLARLNANLSRSNEIYAWRVGCKRDEELSESIRIELRLPLGESDLRGVKWDGVTE